MNLVRPLIVFFLIFSFAAPAQLRVQKLPSKKKKYYGTRLGIGLGRSRSVLFLTRNIKEDNDARGWNTTVVYGLTRIIRLSTEYTWYRTIQIQPTWLNVKAHSIEANVNFLSTMGDRKGKFYPLVGLSYNIFDGYFTGSNDHLNLRALYEPRSQVRTRWVGLNVGCGFEKFIGPLSIFGEFKMRTGVSEGYNQFTIMDVCFSAGARYNLVVPILSKMFDGTRSRYFLRLPPED